MKAGLLSSGNAEETREVIEKMLKGNIVYSISLDSGSEFVEFRKLEKNIKAPVCFAEPHKSWQCGTNENTNDVLRFFYPKGFDFHKISQLQLDAIVDLINNRPHKFLNWKSPIEIYVAFA